MGFGSRGKKALKSDSVILFYQFFKVHIIQYLAKVNNNKMKPYFLG
jgi:hypothetical protein